MNLIELSHIFAHQLATRNDGQRETFNFEKRLFLEFLLFLSFGRFSLLLYACRTFTRRLFLFWFSIQRIFARFMKIQFQTQLTNRLSRFTSESDFTFLRAYYLAKLKLQSIVLCAKQFSAHKYLKSQSDKFKRFSARSREFENQQLWFYFQIFSSYAVQLAREKKTFFLHPRHTKIYGIGWCNFELLLSTTELRLE